MDKIRDLINKTPESKSESSLAPSTMCRADETSLSVRKSPYHAQNLLGPCSWASSLQNCEKQPLVDYKPLSLWYFLL